MSWGRLSLERLEDRTLPSLVGAYALNEGAGTTTADSSGNGNVGTVSNATWTTGKYGNALQFTGANNSFVTIKDASSIDLTNGLTLEAWVNPSTLAHSASQGWVAAVSKDNTASTSNDVAYALYAANGAGTPPALDLLLNGTDVGVQGASVLPLNTWSFLTGTYNGSTMNLYVNGTLVGSNSVSGTITTTADPLHIGGDWDSEMFTGIVDNVRIYNTALTQSQIQTDMNTAISSLTLSPTTLAADTINAPYSQTITTSNGTGTVNLAVSNVQNAIPGLSVPSSGTNTLAIGGTPTATGTETFTVTATDQGGGKVIANYSITVNPAVSLGPPTLPADTVQATYNQTITASNGTGNKSLVVSNIQNAIPGLSVPSSGTNTLTISGTPTATGTETFTVTATDQAGGTATANYSITVNPAVVVTAATLPTGTVKDPYSFTFTASGGSGNGFSFSEVGALPSGMTLSSGGLLSGTPLQSGAFNITVTATDPKGGYGSQAFTLTVNPAVVPAPATLTSATLNTPYSVNFTATGGSGSGYKFAESGALPAGMTFTSAGLLSGTPTQSGSFAITVTATDSNGGSGSITDTLNVGSGSVPTVAIQTPTGNSQDAGSITISATASSSVGVKSVQFAVDGNNVGSAVTTAPYQVIWDSTTVADGNHTITATVTDNNNNTATSTITVQIVNGGVFGTVTSMPTVAINMILMHTGQILLFEGQGTTAQVLNPVSGAFTPVPITRTDLWCASDAQLPDGRILVAGGHNPAGLGSPMVNIFDPATDTWSAGPNMAYPRWYPTATTLPDGRMLVTAGDNTSATDHVPYPEVYDPTTNTWTTLTNAYLSYTSYPHMFVLPNGLIAATGSSVAAQPTYELDVATQTWVPVDLNVVDGASSVMYRPGLVMKEGTASDSGVQGSAAATTYVINLNSPNPIWQQTASMNYARATNTNLVIQPDGNVMIFGGSSSTAGNNNATAVLPTELWNATTRTWKVMASLAVPRMYHSTAVLLPDGRILTSGQGGDVGLTDELSYQIYSPPYLFEGARPTITSVSSSALQYGSNFTINTPDAANISSVVLIRPGATTHGFDEDQRYVPLTFSQSGGALTVQAPANGDLAPPGYYMLFLVNNKGVPSVASWVQLPAGWKDTQPPTAPTNLTASAGTGQVSLSWTASTDNVAVTQYNVYRSATSGFTPSAATLIGTSTTASYTDDVGPGTYYYLVTAQDAAANVSQPSNQATATVTTGGMRMIQNAGQGFMSPASSISLTFPTDVHAGDTLIVSGAASSPRSSITISDSAGDTFVPVIGPVSDSNQDATAYIWIATNVKGGTDTVTLTPTGGADNLEMHISEWSGISQASPVDQTSSATGNGSQISSGAKTTTQNGELVYGYTFLGNNASAGTGFTGLSLTNGDLDEYEIQQTAGSMAATFTQQPANWLALMATFKPASADTQPPTAPANLTATTGNVGSVGLSWTAATDDTAVVQYNIYRSTVSGFTPSSSTLIGTSTTTTYTDTVAAGTYYYLVTAQDTAGLVGPPSNQATGTSQPDTIPPTVSMIAPSNGSTIFGTVGVSATASDDVAVASVQFVLDGVNYGSPITTAPYAFSWNSATVSNGTHTWAAIATSTTGLKTTSSSVSFTVNNNDPAGLVAAYGMDEGSGTLVEDSSTNANNGTVSSATWTTGKYGNALQFTGANNSFVTIKDSSTLDLTKGLTLEAWVNPSTLANAASNGWVAAVAKDNTASANNDTSYSLYAANGAGTPPALYLLLSGSDVGVQGVSVLPLNTWSFLTGTYDGSTMKLYVNGTLVGSNSVSGTITTTADPLHIGGDWDSEMFTGIVDNVRIYNIALSQSQIQTDMNTAISAQPMLLQASFPPPGAAPITPAALAPVVNEAIALWQATGISSNYVALLHEATITLTNLSSPYLGLTSGLQIWISQNADGYGWSINPNPAAAPVPGKLDLLTVVAHELGHVLGYADHYQHDLMDYYLTPGERFLPGGLALRGSAAGQGAGAVAVLDQGQAQPTSTPAPFAALLGEVASMAEARTISIGVAPLTGGFGQTSFDGLALVNELEMPVNLFLHRIMMQFEVEYQLFLSLFLWDGRAPLDLIDSY